MPIRPLAAALLLAATLAAGPAATGPATRPVAPPTGEPPTYQLKSSVEWMPVALDRDDLTRASGVRALSRLAVVQPDLVPLLADLLERDPSATVRGIIAGELPTLVKVQPAAWAARFDAVLTAAADTEMAYTGGRIEAAEAVAALAATDDVTAEQRAATVKILANLLDVQPTPFGINDVSVAELGVAAAKGLTGLAPRDPAAVKALHDGLDSSRTPVRLASISALLKADPTYAPADGGGVGGQAA